MLGGLLTIASINWLMSTGCRSKCKHMKRHYDYEMCLDGNKEYLRKKQLILQQTSTTTYASHKQQ